MILHFDEILFIFIVLLHQTLAYMRHFGVKQDQSTLMY